MTDQLQIPTTPAPATTLANRNVHRLTHPNSHMLLLEPGRSPWMTAIAFSALAPVALVLCIVLRADPRLTIALPLIPLSGALGCCIAGLGYHRFGTRAEFNRETQTVSVSGLRHGDDIHLSLKKICAVQFCNGEWSGQKSRFHFQINLVLREGSSRINLLNSGGKKQLHRIATEIAEFLRVPLAVDLE